MTQKPKPEVLSPRNASEDQRGTASLWVNAMLHRPPARSPQAARQRKAVVRVRIDGAVLDWLSKHYRGKFNPDDLASVGALIGEILEISARL